MTALERQMAADAIALSKEHADRADAAEARWADLRVKLTVDAATEQELGDDYSEMDTEASDERANQYWGAARALREVLAWMDRTDKEGRAMTETTARIRWQDTYAGMDFYGHVGSLPGEAFTIWKPPQASGEWVLTSDLPGLDHARSFDADPEKLKAEAERWLERFVVSLGAIFPGQETATCLRCGASLVRDEFGARSRADEPERGRKFCRDDGMWVAHRVTAAEPVPLHPEESQP